MRLAVARTVVLQGKLHKMPPLSIDMIEERLPAGSSPHHRRLLTATQLGLQWLSCCRTRRCPGGYIGTGFQKLTLVEASVANDKDVRIGAYWNEAGVGVEVGRATEKIQHMTGNKLVANIPGM